MIHWLIFNPIVATVFYGSLLGVMLWLVWRSASVVLLEIGCWVAVAWIGDSISYYALGRMDEPYANIVFDTIAAVMVFFIAIRCRSRIARWTFWTFMLAMLGTGLGFYFHAIGSWLYQPPLSVIFVSRLFILGGAACRVLDWWPDPVSRIFSDPAVSRPGDRARISKTRR